MTRNLMSRPAAARLVCLGAAVLLSSIVSPGAGAEPEPIAPLPAPAAADARAELGRRLFHDPKLSGDARTSCASCHDLDAGGDDGRVRPLGRDGQPLDFNAPSLFNAALSFRLNWRGNFRSLEELTESVLLDPRLMHTSWEQLITELRDDASYVRAFMDIYGAAPQRAQVLDALAAFQRGLVTPDAPFDRYLGGARDAITPDQERGYQLFKSYGCIACHQGANVGGNLFQKFGIFHDPFARRAIVTQADLGRYSVTGARADLHVFRVPSLRNVAVTAPYFHDGSAASLPEAVEIMARSQLGRTIPVEDIDAIVSFLVTLTGRYQGRSLDGASQ